MIEFTTNIYILHKEIYESVKKVEGIEEDISSMEIKMSSIKKL